MSGAEDFVRAVERATGWQGRRVGRHVRLRCPAHDDHDPSLDVAEGGDGRPLVICRSRGCSYEDICRAIGWERRVGAGELWTPHGRAVAVYRYEDEDGRPLFEVCRTASKEFPVRRLDPSSPSGYRWRFGNARRVPYRLPQVLEAAGRGLGIFITEGEKDADALVRLGLVATCNPGGAGKWRREYAEYLRGAHAIVIPDADRVGREHAHAVAESLVAVARSVRILDLAPNVEDKSDVADFLAAARNDEERAQARDLLVELARKAPQFVSARIDVGRAETNPASPGLPFAPIQHALANIPPEPRWTWDGYLAPGTLTLLAGRPKVGKSTLVFGLLAAVEAEELFLGRQTRAAGALLLTEERGSTLRAKTDRFGLGDRVHLLMRHEAQAKTWPEIVLEAVAYCEENGVSIIVVDTWHVWTGLRGDAENEAGAVLEALEPLCLAAGRGLDVLLAAHQRKALGAFGEAVRGSSALIGGVDIVLELERPAADMLAGDGSRVLRAVSRFDSTPEELVLALTDEGYVSQGDGQAVRAHGERRKLLDALEARQEGATADELSAETAIPAGTIRKRLEEAVEAGDVERIGKGVKGDPHRYTLRILSAQPVSLGAESNSEAA